MENIFLSEADYIEKFKSNQIDLNTIPKRIIRKFMTMKFIGEEILFYCSLNNKSYANF